ncbi:hypothetical protein [Streptomyces sp. NPDC056628]|uniref:hypothetical protein n=1 Tax=Streptomyces sp. NPDC056628 TaxID=3345882 RepID=UPI0036AE5957
MTRNHENDDSGRAARKALAEEEERARSQPFGHPYPYPERRVNVRATRRISREEADADLTPDVPGGHGSTGGGRPGGSPGLTPDRDGTLDPSERANTTDAGDVTDDTGRD